MIASLPMYDRAETAAANDRFWKLIHAGLPADAPQALCRHIPDLMTHWQSPDLMLSQTCGFPYRAQLSDKVALVATPVLNLDCPAGHYYSVLIAHKNRAGSPLAAFDGATAAYNDPLSQSGWAVLYHHMEDAGLRLGTRVATGAHVASALAVAEGRADIAAIDALTWQMISKWDSIADALCIIDTTAPTPALPYICSKSARRAAMLRALQDAIYDLPPADKACLGISDITTLSPEAYLAAKTPPAPQPYPA